MNNENICKNCVYFANQNKHEEYDFLVGVCDLSPAEIKEFSSYSMTTTVGENFGCIHFKQLNKGYNNEIIR